MDIKKQTIYLLTVFFIFILIVLWEFQLEELIGQFFGINNVEEENSEEHWEYVTTVTIFAALAMVPPFFVATKLEEKHSKVEEEIKEKEFFYRTIIENSTDVTLTVKQDGEITYASPSVKDLFGYKADFLVDKSVEIFLHSLDAETFMAKIEKATTSYDEVITQKGTRFVHKNGEMVILESFFTQMPNASGEKNIVISCRDVTERVEHEEKIKFLAFHDQLTGLPNRSTFSDRLEMALAQSERDDHKGAVLFLDIDDFKNINDTMGHDAGDELLIKIAHRIKVSLRKEDTVSRLGGDEFTCLLPKVNDDEDVENVAMKIIKEFELPIIVSGKEIMVGFSIGGSIFPTHGHSVEGLIKKADNAMYHVKQHGKRNFHLSS